jgi:replicative DNA helicase
MKTLPDVEMSEPRRVTRAMSVQRPPPHSIEAEQAFLSSAMQARELRVELTPEYFFIPQNRRIFEYLEKALREGKPVEPIAFSDYLETHNVLDSIGGRPYVTELWAMVPSPVLAEYYARILREKYLLRQVIDKCTECVRVAYEDQPEVNDVLEQTQAALTQIILESQQKETIRPIAEGEAAAYQRLERAYKHRGDAVIDGVATGFYDFDRMTTGLLPGQFIVLGARPSQGKTSLALNFAANISLTNQVPVGLFSLEMSYEQIWNRLLSYHGRISRQRWRDGYLSRRDLPRAREKAAEVSKAKLWIDDTPGLSVHQFRSRSRLMKLRFNVQVIVVDYVQIMSASRVRGGKDPRIEVNEISATLKSVAKELGVIVLACAQLNRNVEERTFGKPRMADLKESGALEQDADCVAMLWRPVMHLEGNWDRVKLARELKLKDDNGEDLFTIDKKTGKLEKNQNLDKEQVAERDRQIREYAEIIIVKQRDGPVGNIPLRFVDDLTRFENRTEKMWSNNPAQRQQNLEPEPPALADQPNEMDEAATLAMAKEVFPNAKVLGNGEEEPPM